MRSAGAVWHCRCGYSNTGPRRCAGCHKPSPSFRRQLRKRRLISAACLAATVTVSSAKWSPFVGQAAAPAPTTLAPPLPAPTPPPPLPRRAAHAGRTRPSGPRQRTSVEPRCLAARQAVENAGDRLAAGFEFRCPDSAYPHWGATTFAPCCSVAINVAALGSDDAKLRHVVAHEFCHSNGIHDEQAADDCAARYGFPNIYFKR